MMPDNEWDPDDVVTVTEAPKADRPPLHWIALAEVNIRILRDHMALLELRRACSYLDRALEALTQLRSQLP